MLDLDQLARPSCYPQAPEAVEVLQTHISIVCLAGDRVYKLKKPVRLPFLDYSTLERRAHFCREEVRLNRRLCPWVYLDVVPLHRSPEGLNFRGEGEIVDHAVLMTRLPAERMLDRLLARDAVTGADVAALAELVADFHRRADRGPAVDRAGAPERLSGLMRANFAETRASRGAVFDAELHAAMEAVTETDVETLLPALERRRAAGRIVEGHGDLHARNVCLTSPPAIYDCIEFSEAFRCADVANEIAFMAMDLRYRGHPALAERWTTAYVAASGDEEIPALLPALVRYRAMVRAKVSATVTREPEIGAADRAAAAESARRHLRLAAAVATEERGRLFVAACGPPASGKSRLLESLAATAGWPLVASDRLRKALAGVEPTVRLPPSAYAPAMTERTYGELLGRARASGGVVLLDATWPTRARRDALRAAARETGARLVIVHLDVPPALARQRLAARTQDPSAVSDADVAVYERLAARFEAPGAEEPCVLPLDGALEEGALLDRLLAHLVATPAGRPAQEPSASR